VTSFGICTEDSYHCEHPNNFFEGEGFQITRAKGSNILEIQAYGQYFDTTVDALGASWAGRGILFRQCYWIQLLRASFKNNQDRAFRLTNASTQGYIIGGSYCRHATQISEAELEGCWIGWLLLAENLGGWKRFFRYMGRSDHKPPRAKEQMRRGIMDVPQNAV
jgi:hypothetical protein